MINTRHWRRHDQGLMLLESLIAILVLAIGLLGLLSTQLQSLAIAQDSARRLQASRLIEDLSERIRAQPDAQSVASLWLTQGWEASDPTSADMSCHSSMCSATALASHSRTQWLKNVCATLPLAQANIFASADAQHLGVAVAWRRSSAWSDSSTLPLPAAPGTGISDMQCPADRICHVQLIHLAQVCIPGQANSTACTGA